AAREPGDPGRGAGPEHVRAGAPHTAGRRELLPGGLPRHPRTGPAREPWPSGSGPPATSPPRGRSSVYRQRAGEQSRIRPSSGNSARVGPTTPTRPPRLPLALWQLERLSCCRTLFAAERPSPSARERVRRPPGGAQVPPPPRRGDRPRAILLLA